MFKRNYVLKITFGLFWALPLSLGRGQTSERVSSLDTSVHQYRLTADNFVDALSQVANHFKVPMGIAWVDTPATRTRVALSWTDATVQKVLQDVVETQSGYEISVRNGILHVIATTISPSQNFLLLRIMTFEVRNDVEEMAEYKLRELVRAAVIPPKPGPGGVAGSIISNTGDPKIDLHLSDASVEDILDALVAASIKKVWVVTFTSSPELMVSGFRRTVGFRNNSPIPDDDQPVWEMFRWGEPMSFGATRQAFASQ